jgi:RNA polymerase sigma factor (sigma-70 family)
MASNDLQQAVDAIRNIVLASDAGGLSDRVLLQRFISEQDEAAFEALVCRHGPMILGVCRRVLQNPHDAEDAFQATFLVFVRKARTLVHPELLSNWLYTIAFQTARAARAAAQRRREKEGQVTPRHSEPAVDDWSEIQPLLDEEISRLPAKYRTPLVMCELQQKSRTEVAQALGVPPGTLSSRLARARSLLARRLSHRGIALSSGTIAAACTSAIPAPSAALVQVTLKAGMAVLIGNSAAVGIGSLQAVKLSETVIKMMFLSKLKLVGAVVVSCALLTASAGALAVRDSGQGAAGPGAVAIVDPPGQGKEATDATGTLQQAQAAAAAVEDPKALVDLLLRIGQVQVETGDKRGAAATAEKALLIAQNLKDSLDKVRALCGIASLQDEADNKTQSRETLSLAERITFKSPNGNATVSIVSDPLRLRCMWGEYDALLHIAAEKKYSEFFILRLMATTVRKGNGHEAAARSALQRAAEMVMKLNESNPERPPTTSETNLLELIGAGQARIGYSEDAFRTIDKLDSLKSDGASAATTAATKARAILAIARAQAGAGDLDEAMKTAEMLSSRSQQEEILSLIARAQTQRGDFQAALKTVAKLDSIRDRVDVLHAIALAQIEKGDRQGARAALSEITKLNEASVEGQLRSGSALQLGQRAARAGVEVRLGDFEAALQTAGNITSALEKAQALSEIGAGMLALGRKEEAKQELRRASRSAERVPESNPRTAQTGRRGAGPEPGPRIPANSHTAKLALLRDIAKQQALAGDAEGAFETAESLPRGRNGLTWLITAVAEGGDLAEAVHSLPKLLTLEEKSSALESIARIMTTTGDKPAAAALAAKQTNPLLKAYTLLGIATAKTNKKPQLEE